MADWAEVRAESVMSKEYTATQSDTEHQKHGLSAATLSTPAVQVTPAERVSGCEVRVNLTRRTCPAAPSALGDGGDYDEAPGREQGT
ncbi:hypothetical protein GCM10010234_67460 [Streptomyces hawaiiensis]